MEKDDVNAVDAETVSRIKERSMKLPEKDREAYVQLQLEKAARRARERRMDVGISDKDGTHGVIADGEGMEKKVLHLDEITITVSERDGISGFIRNGNDGAIGHVTTYTDEKGRDHEIVKIILHFCGSVGPAVLIDGETPGIKFNVDGREEVMELGDVVTRMANEFHLGKGGAFRLQEVLAAYVHEEIREGHAELWSGSPIMVIGGKIICKYNDLDVKGILQSIIEYWPRTTFPDAFLSSLTRNLVAPLHSEIKKKARTQVQIPFGLYQGDTKSGKTPMGELIIGEGYAQERREWYFQQGNIDKFFTFMKHLTETNLPCLIDDTDAQWIFDNAQHLKSYSQSGNIADRGRKDQSINRYFGMRTFDITVNSIVRPDDDAALSGRFAVYTFSAYHRDRVDREAYLAFREKIPTGFMFALFHEVFDGKTIDEVIREVQGFDRPEDWEEYGAAKINELCTKYGIGSFRFTRDPQDMNAETNAESIAWAMIDQFAKDHAENDQYDSRTREVIHMRKNVPMFSDNQLQVKIEDGVEGAWHVIYFQGSTYETLVTKLGLKLPYKHAGEFVSNIVPSDQLRVMFGGKTHSVWMGDGGRYVYGLKVLALEDRSTIA